MSFVDDFVAQIISLEVSLYHSRARLQANSDSEALKSIQGSLGSWHDHHQWCLRAEVEPDLLEIAPYWEVASEQALADAELKLASLLDHLEKDLTKSKD